MGEIKSTLDIIMEKTRGLTMTDEEKKAFEKEEVEGRVRGFLQKFIDSIIRLEGLKKEIGAFDEKQRTSANEALIRECIARIDPEAENGSLFDVLEHVAGMDPVPLRNIFYEFQTLLDRQKGEKEKILEESLKERGISGSAVIPNINADSEWIRCLSEMREGFNEKLSLLEKKFYVTE